MMSKKQRIQELEKQVADLQKQMRSLEMRLIEKQTYPAYIPYPNHDP